MSGVSLRSITITRNPFGRVCSIGLGNVPERVGAGGGGVACGVCALTIPMEKAQNSRTVLTQRRKAAKEDAEKDAKENLNSSLRSFSAALRLCARGSIRKR